MPRNNARDIKRWPAYDQELSAYGAAAILRAHGFSAANGRGLAKVSAPRRQGYFTTSYVYRDIIDWTKGVIKQYRKMAAGPSLPVDHGTAKELAEMSEPYRGYAQHRQNDPSTLPVSGAINSAWGPGGDIIRKMR